MNIGWYILVGCFFIVQVLVPVNGSGRDCDRWGGCEEGPGDPGGGTNDPQSDPQPSHHSHQLDKYEYDDCQPWQTSTPNGCRNCSGMGDECNNSIKCCDDLFCGKDGFCACSEGSKDCGHDDDDDQSDDGTLLEAAKIALAVAVVIAAVAAGVLLWRTCSKQRRRRSQSTNWQVRRRARQQSSLTSVQRFVLSRLCDRPPRYEDDNYIKEEKPPPYDVAIATIAVPMTTATLLANTAPFRNLHAENAAYVEDETEPSPVPIHETGVQLCPACLCHCTGATNHAAAAETTHSEANPPRPQHSQSAQVKSTLPCSKVETDHCRTRERDRLSSGRNTASYAPQALQTHKDAATHLEM